MALGLFVSAFASTEFQAMQFMPVVILPQFLLAGLFIPRERMPDVLERISDFLPFTYAYEALAKVAADDISGRLWLDVGIVVGTSVLALALGALTLRRRTP
jgi:ABC-2 type transport system permease protein